MLDSQMSLDFGRFVRDNTINADKVFPLNESVKTKITDTVLEKIFESIIAKYNKIDFGDIPRTRGNITRFRYYNNLYECIKTLLEISENVDYFPEANILSEALSNIIMLKGLFEEGFKKNNAYSIMMYNVLVMSIFESTSIMISTIIDFIQDVEYSEVTITKYRESKKAIYLDSLEKFNATVKDGSFQKYLSKSMEASSLNESITVASIITAIAAKKAIVIGAASVLLALWVATKIVPIVRELVYLIYNAKQGISDIAKVQASFLETNVEILRNKDYDEKVISKQQKAVAVLKNISRKFAVVYDKAERDTNVEIAKDKYDVGELAI